MNKKNNRKGFTTVELVIVIAVIAILATVLIPTFSNLIGKANESAALQEASSIFKSYTIENATTFSGKDLYIKVTSKDGAVTYFAATKGQLDKTPVAADKLNHSYDVIVIADDAKGFAVEVTGTAHAYDADNKCTGANCTATKPAAN